MYLAVALPLLGVPLLARAWRRSLSWCLGFLAAMLFMAASSYLLTGRASAYLSGDGGVRQGTTVCAPDSLPPEVVALRAAAEQSRAAELATTDGASTPGSSTEEASSATGNSFSWLMRVPEVGPIELLQNIGYFLWGRHAGLLPYFPFTALALASFFLFSRGSLSRWLLLLALAAVALYFLLFIGWNWQGGGGFIGNRYYVSMVVGFVFLVERIRMRWLLVTAGVAGLTVGPLVFTPLGAGVPEPTMQFHTRNAPLRYLPLELSLRNVPGYHRLTVAGLRVRGRSDQILPQGESIWLHGGTTTELHLLSDGPLTAGLSVLVSSDAAPNRVVLEMRGARADFEVTEAGQGAVFALHPKPLKMLRQYGTAQYVYRLTARVERGVVRPWTRQYQPPPCDNFAWDATTAENFYRGATLTILGAPGVLDQDVFAAELASGDDVGLPEVMAAGEIREVAVAVTNRSQLAWPTLSNASGAARVKLAYHWFDAQTPLEAAPPTIDRTEAAVWDGRRTEIVTELPPDAATVVALELEAPARPGTYWLIVEPVFEHVGWFSEHGPVGSGPGSDNPAADSPGVGNSLRTLVVVE
jgi:hypothetical protein